jgi:ABC-type nitrate/sulfonate/bicarbonate transport system permease component
MTRDVDERPVAAEPVEDVRPTTDVREVRRLPGKWEQQSRRHTVTEQVVHYSLSIGTPVVLLLLWQLAGSRGWINVRLFPTPSSIWSTGVELARDGQLSHALKVSMLRLLPGLAYGALSGLVLGFLMGMSRHVRWALEPLLTALYTVPKVALLPLFLLLLGVGDAPKVAVFAVSVFFFMWIAVLGATAMVPADYLDVIDTLGGSRWDRFRQVILPYTLPQIFVALRISAGVSVLVLVGVEFVQASDGIGYLIWNSWSLFLAPRMYVGIFVVALLGIVLTELVKVVARVLMPWNKEERPSTDYRL